MRNDSQAIPHLTIDEIERDLVAFSALLEINEEVMLVDGSIPIARLLPPTNIKESDMNSVPTPVENPSAA
jgi:hypothetical protein